MWRDGGGDSEPLRNQSLKNSKTIHLAHRECFLQIEVGSLSEGVKLAEVRIWGFRNTVGGWWAGREGM